MSLVERGIPCAELANEPVTKYGMSAASSAARNFSKTGLTVNAKTRTVKDLKKRSADLAL